MILYIEVALISIESSEEVAGTDSSEKGLAYSYNKTSQSKKT
jgi:hypothetical protein